MRNVLPLLALLAIAAVFSSGCAGPEEKLGRGVRNTCDIVRVGELRNSMEQSAVWGSPSDACTTGVVKGVDRTIARTGIGLYEIITFPFPPYHPVCTKYLSPEPGYPDNYQPGLADDPMYHSDSYIGFSGGDEAGWVPGSTFNVEGP